VTLRDLLQQHGALSLEKQDALSDFLGEHSWWLDLQVGTIDFGSGRVFPVQVIGTESKESGTWLWSWANQPGRIPYALQTAALRLRDFGQANDVAEFTAPELEAGAYDTHVIGATACGVADADAYYLAKYEHGAALLLLQSPALAALLEPSALHMMTIFSSTISAWELEDHRRSFVAYARAKGCTIRESHGCVEITDPTGTPLAADFDDHNRLVAMRYGISERPAGS
jgi:hypothetical protein